MKKVLFSKIAKLILLTILSGFLVSCATPTTLQLHSGVPSTTVSTIKGSTDWTGLGRRYVYILTVDGVSVGEKYRYYNSIEVLSGEHIVVAIYTDYSAGFYSTTGFRSAAVSINCQLLRGRKYHVKAEVKDYKYGFVNFWIEDIDTNQVVGRAEINKKNEL